ncbi:MAG: UDP-N-acetylglucosamine 2-epimerase (hydrolyzing) [Alphaproteobacteria bacterium]|nr:UDP-N-acetylglucosamine 2-epimerase (hydrolyzing) [Alphaproteobacteria bacterium]
MIKKICVITGTRADFGLLRGVIEEMASCPSLEFQLIVTGAHLMAEHGYTFREIEEARIQIDCKVDMHLDDDSPHTVNRGMGHAFHGFADAFDKLQPNMIMVLGDRYEILPPVLAANIANIPVAHIHGGEVTEGAVDDAFRHAVTKLAHLHFVAAPDYRERVIQLGEDPTRIILAGGLGVDAIKRLPLLGKREVEAKLGFEFAEKNLLITFHPVTLEPEESINQMTALLDVLSELQDVQLIFTAPNADVGGRAIGDLINAFVAEHHKAHLRISLGQLVYLSCMQFVDGVVGNSSSGLLEAPTLGVGTVDIGNRQKGRLAASSVINCAPKRENIRVAIETLYAPDFQNVLANIDNPYGKGGACKKIVDTLARLSFENLMTKTFHDYPPHADSHGGGK